MTDPDPRWLEQAQDECRSIARSIARDLGLPSPMFHAVNLIASRLVQRSLEARAEGVREGLVMAAKECDEAPFIKLTCPECDHAGEHDLGPELGHRIRTLAGKAGA